MYKILSLITMYETYLEEIRHLGYEAHTIANKINRELYVMQELSVEEQAQILHALEDMKVRHAKLVTELADFNII